VRGRDDVGFVAISSSRFAGQGEAFHERFKAIFPDEPWRGVKEEEFGVLVMTRMAAVLIEIGFIDCSSTARSMVQGKSRRDMPDAIACGIGEYAGRGAHKIQ